MPHATRLITALEFATLLAIGGPALAGEHGGRRRQASPPPDGKGHGPAVPARAVGRRHDISVRPGSSR